MSAASCLQSEDHFLCSICLEIFNAPVSTPCGHNFCKTCITRHWNSKFLCVCPLCKEVYHTRPEMKVNTFISQMAAEFRLLAKNKSISRLEEPAAKPGEVQCDVCPGAKRKAIKSCLKCEASYCQTHLEPHLKAARLQSHQLVHPVENLEDRMCTKHNEALKLFCKTDQTYVCLICPILDHKNHEFVLLEDEYKGKKAKLGKTEAEILQKIQERRLKIQEMKQSVRSSRGVADREKADGIQIFTTLKQQVEKSQSDFILNVEEKQRSTEKQAEDFIKELQQEILVLKERAAEVRKLSRSEDPLHLSQNFPSINSTPPTKDWTQVKVQQRSHEGSVVKAVAQLEEIMGKEAKRLLELDLKRIQRFAVDVTLDPDTAHPNLILSDDEKQVHLDDDMRKKLPDSPQRFKGWPCVLGKQSFSSGRFYYEVQVKGKTAWTLGVAREKIYRKGSITVRPQDGSWTVLLRNKREYEACEDPPVRLSLRSQPDKVGVFVDYEEGRVSFYDVDAPALIYSFTGCSFTHKLHPYFSPWLNYGGINSAPLIISPVSQPG